LKKIPKVLYVSANGYLGGAERIVCNMAKGHLENNKLDFEILFFSKGDAYDLCKKYGAKLHLLPFSFRLRQVFQLLKTIKYIRKYVKENKFEVVHSTMPYVHIIISFATIFMDVKRVWFQHGPVGGFLDKIANFLPVNLIYFNSNYLENEHLKMLGSNRNKQKHILINYGIDDSSFDFEQVDKIKKQYNPNENKTIFLSAGRLCPWKGQDKLLISYHNLINKKPSIKDNTMLLIVGDVGRKEDQEFANNLYSYVENEKLSDNIKFTGHKNNIQNYYRACDVFIHSSLIPEPFGLVVAESMRNECFVIGSNCGGVTDILKDGITGLSYTSTDADVILNLELVLEKFYSENENNPDEITKMKKSARDLIENEYSINSMCSRIEQDIEILL
jgi:glycosyltransferase involved in cell wall biosynthesis